MPSACCPQCDAVITVNQPRDGTRIMCPGCNVELEIVSTDPFDVYFPFDHDEDWNGGRYEKPDMDWGGNDCER